MRRLRSFAAAALGVVAAACSSGGGHGEVQVTYKPKPSEDAELNCFWLLPFICEWVEPEREAARPTSTSFTSWKATPAYTVDATAASIRSGVSAQMGQNGLLNVTGVNAPTTEPFNIPSYDQNGRPDYSRNFGWFRGAAKPTLGALGEPAIDLAIDSSSGTNNPFADFSYTVAMVANPYALGWDYQSFGAWANSGGIGQVTYGAVTPALSVPLNGKANFSGKLAGFYVSPTGQGAMAAADLTVNADFSARSLSFASSGTFISRSLDAKTDAPHLNLSGTLTYGRGSNSFSGPLTNAGGTMSGAATGLFYGPAAQELGGVFALRSPTTAETMSGGFGARR